MAKALERWKVFPHGRLESLGESAWTVVGEFNMPLTRFERRMTVVRISEGRLVIFSAVALEEAAMRQLEQLGSPTFLVVPNHLHRNDAPVWKQRYPALVVVAPEGVRQKIEEVLAVDTCHPDFADSRLRFVEVPGTGGRDSALEFEDTDGLTLILNDLVGHMPMEAGWVLRLFGFASAKPRIPRVVKLGVIKDKAAVRKQLEAWASRNVARIVVSHGAVVSADCDQVLRELAASL